MTRNAWYAIGGVCLAALVFQVFFHYQYVQLGQGTIMRINRLTGSSCYMPCNPSPAPTATPPSPTATPFDERRYLLESERQDQRAILLAKRTGTARQIMSAVGPNYVWSAKTADPSGRYELGLIRKGQNVRSIPPALTSASFETKLVCMNPRPAHGMPGWCWEVHLDTGEVFSVWDNADLLRKYGFTRVLPQPTQTQ